MNFYMPTQVFQEKNAVRKMVQRLHRLVRKHL